MESQSSDVLQIDTPERVAIEFPVAGIGSRVSAYLLDSAYIFGSVVIVILVLVLLGANGVRVGVLFGKATPKGLAIFISLFLFFLNWGYFFCFEAFRNGQTPGKRLCRIRVMMDDGTPVTFLAAAIRNLLRVVDFLPGFYGLGLLVLFIHERTLRLGDMAAGTLVVRDEAITIQDLQEQVTQISNTETALTALAARTQITLQEYTLLSDFLARTTTLEPVQRFELARELAQPFLERARVTGAEIEQQHRGADRYEKFLRELAKRFVHASGRGR